MLESNATELQVTSEELKSYNSDNDNDKLYETDQLSNEATSTDVPLDFSVVEVRSILFCKCSSFACKMPVFMYGVEIGFM